MTFNFHYNELTLHTPSQQISSLLSNFTMSSNTYDNNTSSTGTYGSSKNNNSDAYGSSNTTGGTGAYDSNNTAGFGSTGHHGRKLPSYCSSSS